MTWLTPGLAGLVAAIALPSLLILYFLKLRRRDVEISTTLLWKRAVQDVHANAPFQKLRRNVLLLIQLLALLSLLTALAQPVMQKTQISSGRIIICIDRSASMSTKDIHDVPSASTMTRLTRAKAEALALIDNLREPNLLGRARAGEAMILTFDTQAQVVQPFTSSKALLRQAIDSIQPSEAPTRFAPAWQLISAYADVSIDEASDTVISHMPLVYLFSDGGFDDIDTLSIPTGAHVQYVPIGSTSATNYAITALRSSRAFDDPSQVSIFVGVTSSATTRGDVDVQLSVDGLVRAVRTVHLDSAKPSTTTSGGVVFTLPRSKGAVVVAHLLSDDDLDYDNTASIILPPAKKLAVGVVTQGNLFMSAALEGLPLSKLETFTPEAFQSLIRTGETERYDVLILDNWVPIEAPLSTVGGPHSDSGLPPGNYLVFGAIPAMPGLGRMAHDDADKSEPAIILDWARQHSALRLITLDNLVLANPMDILVSEAVETLATSTAGPAIVETTHGAVHLIATTFNITETNWPFDVGFVVFLASTVQYLGDTATTISQQTVTPGQTLSMRISNGARDVRLESPDGAIHVLVASEDGRVAFGPIDSTGLYTLTWDGLPGPSDTIVGGRASRMIPVNLLDSTESTAAVRQALEFATGSVVASNGSDSNNSIRRSVELWPYFIMGMIALLLVEWWMYNRRVAL